MRQTIAITGISGYIGRVLLPYLEQDERVEHIIGIDHRPCDGEGESEKLTFHQMGVRDPRVGELFQGVDTVVHLAFVLMRRPGDSIRDIDAINIEGTQAVCEAAARQGVPKLIFTSSVVAYGLHPDNPVPLTEDIPLRPNPDLYYSRAKATVERYMDDFESEHPQMAVTRLRPCTVVGPRADADQMGSLTMDPLILVRGADPLYQLLHEDDLARALHLAIRRDVPGVYNVAADEPCTLRELARFRGAGVVSLPYIIVRGLMGLTWLLGQSPFAPEWTNLLRYPIVVSTEKLQALGWESRYTTKEALTTLLPSYDEQAREKFEVSAEGRSL
jgi:nucleoside-diphosphate-sugar epimerase